MSVPLQRVTDFKIVFLSKEKAGGTVSTTLKKIKMNLFQYYVLK